MLLFESLLTTHHSRSNLCSPRYIDRFRHGLPQSREERRQKASAVGENQLPFWWMSPSSVPPSSTPTKTTDKGIFSLIACLLFLNVGVINCYLLSDFNVESNLSGTLFLWNPFLWTDPVIQPLIDDHGHAIFSPAGQRQHDISLSPCRESLTVCAFVSLLRVN